MSYRDETPLIEADGHLEQSIYAEVSRHRFQYPISGDWLSQVRSGVHVDTSVFSLSLDQLMLLRSRVRLAGEASKVAAQAEIDSEIATDRRLACKTLRYCPLCLSRGWHATVFQSGIVQECPVHRCPLITGCPRCRSPIVCTLRTIARGPFSCDCCGCILSPALYGRAEDDCVGPPSKAFDEINASLGHRSPDSVQGVLNGLQRWNVSDTGGRQAVRRLRMHLVWQVEQPIERPTKVEVILRFDPSSADVPAAPWRQSASAAANDAINRFEGLLETTYLGGAPKRRHVFPPRPTRKTWLPIQALATLKRLYDQHGGSFGGGTNQFSPWRGMTTQCASRIAYAIAAAEWLDLAAQSLAIVAMSIRDPKGPPPWQRLATANRLPWKLQRNDGWAELHMKPRATIASVQRLVRRYAHSWIESSIYAEIRTGVETEA